MQVPGPVRVRARHQRRRTRSACSSGSGDEARLVAGGHSLLPMMKLRLANLEYLIDINDLHDELGYVRVDADEVRIGAMTRHRELLESDRAGRAVPDLRATPSG